MTALKECTRCTHCITRHNVVKGHVIERPL